MYSRKFGQNGLPPDYGGISFRQPPIEKDSPANSSALDTEPDYVPRYPTEPIKRPVPSRSYAFKQKEKPKPTPQEPDLPKENEKPKKSGLSALTSHSFTMEDIVLAGLILLLLNSDCDSELLLILGFLLLVGLQ